MVKINSVNSLSNEILLFLVNDAKVSSPNVYASFVDSNKDCVKYSALVFYVTA